MLSLTSISKFQESLASQQKFKMQKAGILIEKKRMEYIQLFTIKSDTF